MRGFFNIDGPFYKFGNMLADIMILSVLWWVFCIPLAFCVTILISVGVDISVIILMIPFGIPMGAATTAMFYITTRRVTNRDGYLFRDFFKSLKNNFKQSMIAWVILSAIGVVLFINISNMAELTISPMLKMFLYPFQIVFLIELILNTLYIFVVIARFDMKMKDIVKTAVFMVHRHLLTTAMLVILLLGVLLAGDMYPLFYVVAPGAYAYVTSYLFIKIFKKYRPEIDEDQYAEIDRQHEEKLRLERIEDRKPVSSVMPIPVQSDEIIEREGIPKEETEN